MSSIRYCTAAEIEYGRFRNQYIIVSIGNISKNKNQKLLIDAIKFLDKELQKKVAVIVIGVNEQLIADEAEKYSNIFFTGALSRCEVGKILKHADLCVMTSLNEGFGLPIVEGYSLGVPAVIPRAVDAFFDLYQKQVCLSFEHYAPEEVARRIEEALTKSWDKHEIQQFALQFSVERCAQQYCALLKDACRIGKSPISLDKAVNLYNQSLKGKE